MPNGGVPMHLEFHLDPPLVGEWLWHQQGPVLEVRRITSVDPLAAGPVVAHAEVTAEFLAGVVNAVLSGRSSMRFEQPAGEGRLVLAFEDGSLDVTAGDERVGSIHGPLLETVAAFMAYWVDHDGLQVPRSLPVEYPSRVPGGDQGTWLLNFSF
jgi:hypothetical protein